MTYSTTKLVLVVSLVLFVGFADSVFGQYRRGIPQRQPLMPPSEAQQQQPQQEMLQQGTPQQQRMSQQERMTQQQQERMAQQERMRQQQQERTLQQQERVTQQQRMTQQQQMRQPPAPVISHQRVLIISAGCLPDAPNFGGLNGTGFDADALVRAFETTGIPSENIIFQSKSGWTQEAVQGRLDELKAVSRPGDSLIIVLIGKTVQKNGLHYFCAADTTDSSITSNTNTGLIRISTLADQIASAAATHKALILDLVGNDGFPDFSNLEPEGLWLLTSAAAKEDSLREGGLIAGSREVRGVFNFYLTQGLLGMADLIGNNDGTVSFNELANYATQNTRAHAERAKTRQTPQMLGTMVQQVGTTTAFNIGQKKDETFAVNQHVFDESHLIKSLSQYLAMVGNAIVMSAQADVRQAFADAEEHSRKSMGQENAEVSDVTNYLKRQGDANVFAIANFLNPALDDPENKMARLAIATASRAWGDYIDALPNYRDAGELFELYVVAQLGDLGEEAKREDQYSKFGNDLTLEKVPLRPEASTNARATVQLRRGAKVFAQEYATGSSGHPNDGWLKVRVYPSLEPDYVEGWVHRDYLYWSPEAAEWYTPDDGLTRMYTARAESFMNQARALERDAAARQQRGQRIGTIGGIVGSFVPYGGYVQMGTSAAAAVAFSRAAAQRGAAVGAWSQFLHWQQVGEEHRAQLKTVEEQTEYFEGARIIIDPNDLPFSF